MNQVYKNVCIRCGKERIVSRVRKEKVNGSVVITTDTICPDPECQSKVNSENKKIADRRKAMELRTRNRQHHTVKPK